MIFSYTLEVQERLKLLQQDVETTQEIQKKLDSFANELRRGLNVNCGTYSVKEFRF